MNQDHYSGRDQVDEIEPLDEHRRGREFAQFALARKAFLRACSKATWAAARRIMRQDACLAFRAAAAARFDRPNASATFASWARPSFDCCMKALARATTQPCFEGVRPEYVLHQGMWCVNRRRE